MIVSCTQFHKTYGPVRTPLTWGTDGIYPRGSDPFTATSVDGLITFFMVGFLSQVRMRMDFGSMMKLWAGSTLERNFSLGSTETPRHIGSMTNRVLTIVNFGTPLARVLYNSRKINF